MSRYRLRTRIMAIMPVMNSTIIREFMMENTWMSSSLADCRYMSQRRAQDTSSDLRHTTSYVNTTSVPGVSTVWGSSSSRDTGRVDVHVFKFPAHSALPGSAFA